MTGRQRFFRIASRATHSIARRIERLAGPVAVSSGADTGEHGTATAGSRATDDGGMARSSQADAARPQSAADARAAEYEALLDEVARTLGARLEEAELPLHILLSSPFGELNENQEEMLGSARSAVEAADTEVRRLRKLIELDRGALPVCPHPIGLAELLRPALAIAKARAEGAHVQLRVVVSDTAPRVIADATLAQEALTALLNASVARSAAGGEVSVEARDTPEGRIRIVMSPSSGAAGPPLELRLAHRLLALQHGSFSDTDGRTIVELPSEGSAATSGGLRGA